MLEAQIATAVREAMIREGIDTSNLYIRTLSYTVELGDVFNAKVEIVDGDYNSSTQTFHIVESEKDFFEVI